MTNPISIGLKLTGSTGPAKAAAPAAPGFAILLDTAAAGLAQTRAGSTASPAPVALVPEAGADAEALFDALGALFLSLDGIGQSIKDELPADSDALDALAGLLDMVAEMLDTGAVTDPDSPLLAQLGDLARSLGIDMKAGGEAGAADGLEALAALATRIGAHLRETEPGLAAALTGVAGRLDAKVAAIETALAHGEPDAATKLKLIDSETRPNASAAISRNEAATPPANATPVPDDAPPADGKGRTLTAGSDEEPQARPAQAGAQARPDAAGAAVAATGGLAASGEAASDAPDGLTLPPAQSQGASNAPGAVRLEAAAYTRPEPRINVPHIAVEIARSIQNGVSRFEIRLNPPELGRVDVRIEMDQSGNVIARLAVEKSETLDLLQRDQRALERALADAGLDGDKTNLEFSLRQESGGREQPERNGWKATIAADPEIAGHETPLSPGAMRGYARLDAVNLWV